MGAEPVLGSEIDDQPRKLTIRLDAGGPRLGLQ
jgi:hypothetical protein